MQPDLCKLLRLQGCHPPNTNEQFLNMFLTKIQTSRVLIKQGFFYKSIASALYIHFRSVFDRSLSVYQPALLQRHTRPLQTHKCPLNVAGFSQPKGMIIDYS